MASSSWEDLRRRARTTENNIDVKLVSLNKLNSHTTRLDLEEKTATARQTMFDSLTQEIDALITKLSIINDEMCELLAAPSSSGWSQSPAVQHTLRRHQEILRDYRSEFRRARENVQQQLQREILLAGSTNEQSCLNNRVKGSDMYLKENDHIGSCDRLLDEQISIAMSTKENLNRQSMSLRGITRKMQSITQKYPMLNNVMQKIQRKKQKDTIILGLVISGCTCATDYRYRLMKEHKQCYDCYSSVDDVKKCVREGHQVLILMRGVPGSGKTHLAKELLSLRQDGIICSTDEYFLDNQGNYKFNIGLLGEYHKKNCNKAREAINNDVTPVIIDNTNIRGEYMKPYILQACKRYYEIYIVEPKTPWSRKAGQCAIHNTHGVTKEAIMEMLDDMDLEQNPSLESLLGKGYKVVLDPPMEGHDDDDQDMNDISLAQTLAPSSIPILFTPPPGFSTPNVTNVDPLFSLHHVPKPLKKTVEVRDMATQATDVIVALSLVGLSDIIDDVVEEDCREHERDVEMPDTKERKTQYVKRETDDEYPTDLDMLVSIYPSEDMSTLYHNYLQYGLIMTIRMNCDVGLMPDHTAEVIAGSFNKEIAKALETGSFEHESIADSAFSDANTSTSNSEQIDEVEERIYEVDIGKDLFKQLEAHFGGSCNDNRSSSTKAFLPEPFLRKLYEAVLHQQLAGCMDTSDVDRDAEYARKLQDSEDYSALPPKNQMNGAQYLQFQQLLRDYPQYNPDTLQTLYASMGFNATETIRCLSDTDHPPKPLPQSAKPFANNVKPATKRHLPPSRNEDTPSYYDSTKKSHKSHYFDKAHRAVIHHIEKANVIKEKKDRIISEAYKCHSGSGLKSLYSVVHRQNAATLAKQERAELIKVRDIIFEANRQSKYLDLHYLTQQDALKMVKERFEQLDRKDGRRGPIRYLTIVTGYGKTSGEREIVKKFITGWLTSKQYKYHFSNKGSIEVTCK